MRALLQIFFGMSDEGIIKCWVEQATEIERLLIYVPQDISDSGKAGNCSNGFNCKNDEISFVYNREGLENWLNKYVNLSNYKFISCESIFDIEKEIDRKEFTYLQELVEKYQNEFSVEMATYRHFGSLPCDNEIFALSTLDKNSIVSDLFNVIEDKSVPIILVGAGPSLKNNAEVLKKAQGKSLIISASHAALTLYNVGIVPDLVAEIDASSNPDFEFLNYDTEKKYRLLVSSHVKKKTLMDYYGRSILFDFDTDVFPLKCLQDIPKSNEGSGSVINEVFDLFLEAGFRKFILVGVDLAFGSDGCTHAGGEVQKASLLKARSMVKGIDGEMLETRSDWVRFREHYEKRIKMYNDMDLIDATEGGALIEGTRIMRLVDAVSEYCVTDYDIEKYFGQMPSALSSDEMAEWHNYMVNKKEQLLRIQEKANKAIGYSDRLMEMIKNNAVDNGTFGMLCDMYDSCYHAVLDGEGSEILIFYCEGILQDYIQGKLIVEQSGDIIEKLSLENSMFKGVKAGAEDLIKCISQAYSLTADD